MAFFDMGGSELGNSLHRLLSAKEILPGDQPSYETCKAILELHPLGQKMAEGPVKIAQSQERVIEIPGHPNEVRSAFLREWLKVGANKHIRNFVKTSRAYGIATIAVLQEGVAPDEPLDFSTLYNTRISFNVLDPLNTAGSLVLNQDPNAMDFQKWTDVRVNAQLYHRSRVTVLLNEEPIYISYTVSAFGFVGRSVYQRALYPLKTFVQTMITNDLVVRKVGVLVAKLQQTTSAVSKVVMDLFGKKRDVLKQAQTGNVISVGADESIESLNLQNLDAPYALARNNVLKDIATSMDAPAKFMDQETMVEGFGEGTEDAKNVARWINGIREDMQPAYAWFDAIVQYRAWNPNFFKALQNEYPDLYRDMKYDEALTQWKNAFQAEWPSLLIEPESERAKADDIKIKAWISVIELLTPVLDPDNKARLITWFVDNLNSVSVLFPVPMDLDYEELVDFIVNNNEDQGSIEPGEDIKQSDRVLPFKPETVMKS